jgi:hypothetical protein
MATDLSSTFWQYHSASSSNYDTDPTGSPKEMVQGAQSDGEARIFPFRGEMSPLRFESSESLSDISDPDVGSVVRIGTVTHKSVANSTVDHEHPPVYPLYAHASIPDLGRHPRKTVSSRSLGLMTPSPVDSRLGTVGVPGEFQPETPIDGLEGGSEQLNRDNQPERMIPGETEGRLSGQEPCSGRQYPDLFPSGLRMGSPPKRNADTPVNTISSPPPLLAFFPPTPVESTHSGHDRVSEDSSDAGSDTAGLESRSAGAKSPSIVVGHTGASTPDSGVRGASTFTRPNIAAFDYGEYTEGYYGPQGTSNVASGVGTSPVGSHNPYRNEDVRKDNRVFGRDDLGYSTGSLSRVPSYSGSEWPGNRTIAKGVNDFQSLGNEKPIYDREYSRYKAERRAPGNHNPFSHVIHDLEGMLNQALEIAGRAVESSHSALDQRDASLRSSRLGSEMGTGSMRRSFPGSTFDTPNAVTAPESMIDPEEMYRERRDGTYSKNTTLTPFLKRKELINGANMEDDLSAFAMATELPEHLMATRRGKLGTENQTFSNSTNTAHEILPHPYDSVSKVSLAQQNKGNPEVRESISNGTFDAQRFRMEVGRDGEIILVRLTSREIARNKAQSPRLSDGGGAGYNGGWEWSLWEKRISASLACTVFGLVGWITGNYHAEGQAIQEHLLISPGLASLGNSLFYLALAFPVFFLWPLPLLHGRKPYILMAVALLLPLQLPQALSMPPYTTEPELWARSMRPYVICVIFFRVVAGLALGLAVMNTLSLIVDLFGPDSGACCRGGVVYNTTVPLERHNQFLLVPGGEAGVRIGMWLGVYVWLLTSISGVGFLVGKVTTVSSTPAWGFWIVAIFAGIVLCLVILSPEVRPPWKKTKLTTRNGQKERPQNSDCSVERGELKLVMLGSSPYWWWEEVHAGLVLNFGMLKQPGLLLLAIYAGWVFGHLVMSMSVRSSGRTFLSPC